MRIKVGTRGSKLARLQTGTVVDALRARFPEAEFDTVVVKSAGDRQPDRPLNELEGAGAFTGELEQALLRGEIDFAVHSMKDLPARLADGLCLAPSPRREDPRDALALREGLRGLDDLPPGARLGTGSARRRVALAALRPDVERVAIRGNVDTRLGKVGTELDGVVLAAAGLRRAGLAGRITQLLDVEVMVPAPAQGVLALELRRDDRDLMAMLSALEDRETTLAARAERAFLKATGAGCHAPVGAYCRLRGGEAELLGLYGGPEEGPRAVTGKLSGPAHTAEDLGKALAERLLKTYEEAAR